MRWLNDLSRQFLEKDYLQPGETPEQRIDIIAHTAETILNKPGFAAKFKDYMSRGWYSLSTPIWTNFGTNRGLPISCITGDVWINTKNNGGKQARDIQIGDELLTHKGRYRRVTNIVKTSNRSNIYTLKVGSRMTSLHITENHLVLTNLGWVRVDQLNPKKHLVAINAKIEYVETPYKISLKDFCDYDYVEKDNRIYKGGATTVRKDRQVDIVSYYSAPFGNIDFDKDLAWAFGLWFAEGSLSTNDNGDPNGIRVTVNCDDEKQYGDLWLKIISDKFGINGNTYESTVTINNKENKWYTVNANSRLVGNLFASFGIGCKEKTIPQWIIDSPLSILQAFVDGILLGDGSRKKTGTIRITLSNPKLILQIYQIGLKLGLDMSLQMQEKAGKLATTTHVYTILFRGYTQSTARFSCGSAIAFYDGLYYAPIRYLQLTDKVEDVYDFSVEEDHSFSAAGVIIHNCYGTYMEDDSASIIEAQAEISMMSKQGGGTSLYAGKLRGRGSPIQGGCNGYSGGSVHFTQLFNTSINVWSQGSTRRGSIAIYQDLDHPDAEEFLTIKGEGSPIQDINFGVCVKDDWLHDMIAGDKAKRKLWAKVLESRNNTGYPYIFFVDTANRNTVDVYKDLGLRINATNLCCVSGNQRVVSDQGLLTAKELYELNKPIVLFDGEKNIPASEMKLISECEPTYKITLKNGITHTITNCHKIQTDCGMKRLDELSIGDRVAIQTQSGIFGINHMPDEAFLLGLYQADGTQTDKTVFIDIWEHDFDLKEEIYNKLDTVYSKYGWNSYSTTMPHGKTCIVSRATPKFIYQNTSQSKVKKLRIQSAKLKLIDFQKGCIPQWIWEADEKTQWEYVRGLFYADGTVSVNSKIKAIHLSIANINKQFLEELQILLCNLGINMSLSILRKEGETNLPDGQGGYKLYPTKTCYRLVCGNAKQATIFENHTRFLSRKGIFLNLKKAFYRNKKYSQIVSIEKTKNEPVYCCEVYTDKHQWVCNGVITHNSEIMQPSNNYWSFVCDLSSMNDLYYDEWKDTDAVEVIIYMLDAVMTEFINRAKNIPYMNRAVSYAESNRALGLGQLGWHSYLQSRGIPWESWKAKQLNAEIAKNIHDKAYAASKKMFVEYGASLMMQPYRRRHAVLLAIAPTTSSSFIIEQTSASIEPFRSNYYHKDLAKGKFSIKNRYLEELLELKGKNDRVTWKSILEHGGSVQHLQFLEEEEKNVFKTFGEISPMEIIVQAAQRQQYIDQGQSLNLLIDPATPVKDVNALVLKAWELELKSLYYQFNVNAAQQLARGILLSCVSCEA